MSHESLQSAVVDFAELKASATGTYQSLIPLNKPMSGQQYRFEVDLESCTGCKSCVTACHSMNGLDKEETWRRVGSVEAVENAFRPFFQTITSSCHHCLEPACAIGCPVQAYQKDPLSGIVRHLDDQCIGCQYCVMMCPYEVPVYNKRLGIVRKCDMCEGRLASGDAPACAQACPTAAIQIGIVNAESLVDTALPQTKLMPGSADSRITRPSTLYKGAEHFPDDLLHSDHFRNSAQDRHEPLVWMLLLSQMGVGMLLWEAFGLAMGWSLSKACSGVAVLLVAIAMGLATLHLGRPQFAFRFVLGLRTSWMSREILVFSLFLGLASLWLMQESWQWPLPSAAWSLWKTALLLLGLGGIACSLMIYIRTQRAVWSRSRCVLRFAGSTLLLGLLGLLVAAWIFDSGSSLSQWPEMLGFLLLMLLGKAAAELWEWIPKAKEDPILGQVRRLLSEGLRPWSRLRWAAWSLAMLGLLPILWTQPFGFGLAAVALACLVGEYCERSLFFRAALVPRMPMA